MPFFIKDKSGKYRDADGQWKDTLSFGTRLSESLAHYPTAIAAQTALNQFSRMSLADTGARVVEE